MATPLYRQPATDFWKAIVDEGESTSYDAGVQLFRRGTIAKGIYLVKTGAVRLELPSSLPGEYVIRNAGPGAILALGEVMAGDRHELTAETSTPSEICYVERRRLLEMLRTAPEACMQAVQLLSEDLRGLYHVIRQQASTPGRRRKITPPATPID